MNCCFRASHHPVVVAGVCVGTACAHLANTLD